jgi:hypothetical protein
MRTMRKTGILPGSESADIAIGGITTNGAGAIDTDAGAERGIDGGRASGRCC